MGKLYSTIIWTMGDENFTQILIKCVCADPKMEIKKKKKNLKCNANKSLSNFALMTSKMRKMKTESF